MVDRQIRFKLSIPAADGNARLRIPVPNRCIDRQVNLTDSQIQLSFFWQENHLCRRKDVRIISHWRAKTSTEREETPTKRESAQYCQQEKGNAAVFELNQTFM
jgi:hypothetical protein